MNNYSFKQYTRFFFSIFYFSIYTTFSVSAQELDWYVQPIITNAHTIQMIFHEHKFVMIKDEADNVGLKTFDNKLIVPTKYKTISILESEKAIKASEKYSGGKQDFYDFHGNAIDEIPKKVYRQILNDQYNNRDKEKLETYFKKFPKIKFELNDKKSNHRSRNQLEYVAINSKGDTIIENIKYDPNHKIYIRELGDKYLYKKSKLYNFEGELVKDFGDIVVFNELNNGWLSVLKGETYYLYDENLNFILKDDSFIYSIIDSSFYLTKRKNLFLKKMDGSVINDFPFDHYYQIEGTNSISLESADGGYAQIYNTSTDKLFQLKYKHSYRKMRFQKMDILQEVHENGKFGVVNMLTGNLLFDIEYGYVEVYKNYIVTAPLGAKNDKDAFNMYSIFDKKGKLLKEVLSTRPDIFDHYIVLKTKDDHKLYNEGFKPLKELEYDKFYWLNNRMKSLVLKDKDKSKQRVFFLKDIKDGKDMPYGRFEMSGANFYPYPLKSLAVLRSIDNKVGARRNEEIVIPFILDEILNVLDEDESFLVVKKDGKLGVLMNPKL